MKTDDSDDRFAEFLDQFVSYLEGDADPPTIDHFGPEDRRDLSAMFRVIEANWASEIELPPFEKDPVAIALGFTSAGAVAPIVVAGSRVRAVRQAMHLSRSELVAAVTNRGWPITSTELAVLERAEVENLPAPHAAALALALHTDPEALAPIRDDPVSEFLAWLNSDEFDRVVSNWAAKHHRVVDSVAKEVRIKMLSPARRSGGPGGPSQWLQTLRAILEAME